MRRSVEQAAQTRRRILAQAVRRLREGGAGAVRVVPIMHDCGLTHGGFYTHFASRDALLCEAIAQMTAESDVLQRLSRGSSPPAQAFADFLEHYLSDGHCERRPGACPLPILLPDADKLLPEAQATALGLVASLTDWLAKVLRGLGRASPRADANRLLAEVIGLITLARAQPDRTLRQTQLARAREDLAAAYGVAPPLTTKADPDQGSSQTDAGRLQPQRQASQAVERLTP